MSKKDIPIIKLTEDNSKRGYCPFSLESSYINSIHFVLIKDYEQIDNIIKLKAWDSFQVNSCGTIFKCILKDCSIEVPKVNTLDGLIDISSIKEGTEVSVSIICVIIEVVYPKSDSPWDFIYNPIKR